MRVYVTGSTGSGKTTLAGRISEGYGIPAYALDEIVWDNSGGLAGRRFPEAVRDERIREIARGPAWVAEGIYVDAWMQPLLGAADLVLLLSPATVVRDARLCKRYLMGKLGRGDPRESLAALRRNVAWGHRYDSQVKPAVFNALREWGVPCLVCPPGDPSTALPLSFGDDRKTEPPHRAARTFLQP